ncbi:hypothetical protein [Pseudoalteromonas luteoviolacea]|uniref:Uncharacterized protein n=1 Tax=Pseudoalteromonas luteoviolacea S4054 TaxID=1129367 RepID=A0A0F6A559_9GAMM|nr:hypothetical protein [Pseudoalteromonas luteoviolacea]AOT07585.1 hypothetical protein S4054249_06905 [Pseudoalteromonas luteoviolacea]AOT12501.1 hypothetical protein S40542_06905 [Pseudoalteromonas luteoviolacea]AOT17415.1 hypothetical protein S4054_06905 [Pseudoalteromonas luteoviolacea]KKE81325.1 hypothetical protein N479_22580 [Pseudoalteromonas luteoviolacea S4054]KZN70666.1 hypothetical protein N481_20850 [Pseudoalteromonas luteoviolacea S4047-1]
MIKRFKTFKYWTDNIIAKSLILVVMLVATSASAGIQGQIVANSPTTPSVPIKTGDESATLLFDVQGAQSFRVELVVPVDGASVQLFDPRGNVVVDINDPKTQFIAGAELDAVNPLPGGIFLLPEQLQPQSGQWKAVVRFPTATYDMVVMSTVFMRSNLQVGMAIARTEYLVDEVAPLAVIILDKGLPIAGASPEFTITGPDGINTVLIAQDNGEEADAQKADGIYSIDFLLGKPGQYKVSMTVDINTSNGMVRRTDGMMLDVKSPFIDVNGITYDKVLGSTGCVEAINARVNLEVLEAGQYVVNLDASDGENKFLSNKNVSLPAGASVINLNYSRDALKANLNKTSQYQLTKFWVNKVDAEGIHLAALLPDHVLTTDTTYADLCRDDIEITPEITEAPVLADGYYSGIDVSFPVYVKQSGRYQVSLKTFAENNTDLGLTTFSVDLAAGNNEVMFNVSNKALAKADGPYRFVGLLVTKGRVSARLNLLGESRVYKKEQFMPVFTAVFDAQQYALERSNWQTSPVTPSNNTRVGGYLRSGASILYDYETLLTFSPEISGSHVLEAKLIIEVGESSLMSPFNTIEVFNQNKLTLNGRAVSYDDFCQSFNVCPAWD